MEKPFITNLVPPSDRLFDKIDGYSHTGVARKYLTGIGTIKCFTYCQFIFILCPARETWKFEYLQFVDRRVEASGYGRRLVFKRVVSLNPSTGYSHCCKIWNTVVWNDRLHRFGSMLLFCWKMGQSRRLLLIFSTTFVELTVDFSGIRTQIVGLEGDYYKVCWGRPYVQVHIKEMTIESVKQIPKYIVTTQLGISSPCTQGNNR